MRIYLEPHGCALSYGEAELLGKQVEQKGHLVVSSASDADCLVLHTCIVIESTELKMLTRIKKLRALKKPLIISGCLANVMPSKISELAPSARVVPTQKLMVIPEIVKISPSKISGSQIQPKSREVKSIHSTLPIATGCLGNCTFCITKLARGALRSYSPVKILEHAKVAIQQGAKELRLAAQDTACYGRDIRCSLPELVKKVVALEGDFRIRIGMMNVDTAMQVLDELIEVYKNEKVYKFLHLPVQSGSEKILKLMGRKYSISDFRWVVKKFRDNFPGLTLSTDLIAGFPSESEADHKLSLDLLKTLKPEIVNLKAFSPRAGTKAFRLKPRLNSKTVKLRTRELSELRLKISQRKLEKFIGRTLKILITEDGKNHTVMGRTLGYKPVVLNEKLQLGEYVNVKIVGAERTYLKGIMI